jgi:Holliday junction resolvase-like predicted endonuclease
VKGRMAETIVEELLKDLGFQVFPFGMEKIMNGAIDIIERGEKNEVSKKIRKMPDYVISKENQTYFVEVKYRANETLKLSEIENGDDYPYPKALFILVSKKHIKCISYDELKENKIISHKTKGFMLGNRKEFKSSDRNIIIQYCNIVKSIFQNVE